MYAPADMELPVSFKPADNRSPPHKTWLHRQRDAGTAFKTSPALFAATERETREAMALTFGMIAMIDDGIGRILAELRRLGLDGNTVVVFTTDHGDYMGEHQLLLKGPLHYQGIVRQPFLWHDPAAPQNGRRSAAFAGMQDIAPTVLERAGLQPFNGMHGRSMLGLIEGRTDRHREEILIEEEGQRVYLGFDERVRCRTLFDGAHRISVYAGAAWGELYDWRADPHELVNLWDDPGHAGARSRMLEKLARAMLDAADTSPLPTSIA
jgi:arylsulfatase A-like enzyme